MERQKELTGPYPSSTLKEPLQPTANCISSFPLSLCFHFAAEKKKKKSSHKITLITAY